MPRGPACPREGLVPVVRVFRRALEAREIDVHQAEALRVACRPFEVVHQRPDVIAEQFDVVCHAPGGGRLHRLAQVCSEIADPAGIGNGAGDVVRFGEARPALGDVERRQRRPVPVLQLPEQDPQVVRSDRPADPVRSYSGNAAIWNGTFSIASAVAEGLSTPRPVATFTG